MAQIISQDDWGEKLGKSLGQGLERGLNTLAQFKLRDIHQRQQESWMDRQRAKQVKETERGLSAMFPDVEPGRIGELANLGPDLLKHLLSPRGLMRQKLGGAADELIGTRSAMNRIRPTEDAMMENLGMIPPQQQVIPAQTSLAQAMAPKAKAPTPLVGARTNKLGSIRKKKLSNKLVDFFLKKTGNDPKKAREMAIAAGYQV
jgi:hypothetical protein